MCGLDATLAPDGEVGIVVVLRKGGQDVLALITRGLTGATVADVIKSVASKGDCRVGLAGVRVTHPIDKWAVQTFSADNSISSGGSESFMLTGTTVTPTAAGASGIAATTDTVADGLLPVNALGWRGLTGVQVFGGALVAAVETYDSLKKVRALVLTTSKK